ncbi:hypothetical protein FQZ97_1070560 [compost metagenome]
MVVSRVAGRLLEGAPRPEQPRHHVPVGHVVVADGDEDRRRQRLQPGRSGGEFGGQAALGDVAGDQDQVGRGGAGVIQRRRRRVNMLAAEMHVRELQDAPH